jgi:aromatic ring hydroxylase
MAAVLAETISSTSETLGPMTGRRYIESLRDGREVWIDGVRVDDVTTHPAFKEMIAELARIYDLQNSEKHRDEMTCIDPATGRRISVSWLLPRSGEDLKRKRRNSELWNELSWGQLGRSPTSWHRTSSPRSTSKTNSVRSSIRNAISAKISRITTDTA